VHYHPHGAKTPMDACRQFAPLIEDAAHRKADLGRAGRNFNLRRCRLELCRLCRKHSRSFHGLLRGIGEEARTLHRGGAHRTRQASIVQRGQSSSGPMAMSPENIGKSVCPTASTTKACRRRRLSGLRHAAWAR
jgi:hypothetical protein